jgi:hypothetical protein
MKTTVHFDNPLQPILQAELGRGNRVLEVSEWPPSCRKLVLLERPFRTRHPLAPGVAFETLNDPRYWKAEYRFEVAPGVWECLACGF